MRMRIGGFGLFCLALLFLGDSNAWADVTPVQTASIAPAYAVWSPQTTFQGADPLVFGQFNPALGSLESVNVTMAYTFSDKVSMTFANPSGSQTIVLRSSFPQTPDVGPSVTLGGPASGPLSTLLTASAPVVTYTKTFGGTGQTSPQTFSNNPAQFSPGSPFFLTPDGQPNNTFSTFTGSKSITITDPTQLALFTGSGTVGLPASATFGATGHETGRNDSGSLTTYAGITVKLTYTYVPEPSSMALMVLGGGGLLAVSRIRSRKTVL